MIRYKNVVSFTRHTSCGEPFTVYREVPLVLRIDDRFLDCSVYLYPSEADAKAGARTGGSGFLVAVPGYGAGWLLGGRCPLADIHHLYAVTCRHLIRHPDHDFTPKPVVRLNRHDGDSDVIPAGVGDWLCSGEHDLAVLPIPFRQYHRYLAVGTSSFLTKNVAASHDVGIGDEVFMVGRFVSHDGKQRNQPSVRFGHVAMMPSDPVYHPSNASGLQESFIVEVHSISGYSGSPVFVRPLVIPKLPIQASTSNTHVMDYLPGFGRSPPSLVNGPWLLGVEWGYMGSRDHDQRKNNTGMSGVVPAWCLFDLLNTENLVMQRKREQQVEKDRAEQGGTVETGGKGELPS